MATRMPYVALSIISETDAVRAMDIPIYKDSGILGSFGAKKEKNSKLDITFTIVDWCWHSYFD
jgi:hypothetical protein